MKIMNIVGRQAKTGLCVASFAVMSMASAQFNYADFGNLAGLNLTGHAVQNGNSVRLTQFAFSQRGYMWHETKQRVDLGFETTFQFRNDYIWGGDGFTFAIQNFDGSFQAGPDSEGAGLGYHDALANSVVIEFDTYRNGWDPLSQKFWNRIQDGDGWRLERYDYTISDPWWYMPSDNHVAIHTRGVFPNSADYSVSGLAWGEPDFYFKDGAVHTAKVVYDATAHTLSVFFNGAETATVVANINLAETLNLDNGTAWVGFTASNGNMVNRHDLMSWSFDPADAGVSPISWSGFLAPLTDGGTHKLGSTVPVKFKLTGDSSAIADLNATATIDGVAVGAFRYDATAGQYIFNWKTRGMAPGTYTLGVDMGDGEVRNITVRLRS
jgi:hypothetical protein